VSGLFNRENNAMESEAVPGPVLWEETIPGGMQWSGIVRRGVTLRLTALGAGANVSALLYNHEDRTERYNMPDTLKAQHTAFLTRGHVCYSDMGRVLCSITADSAGWNDTVCGATDDALIREKYGVKRFQEHRNAMYRSAREGFLKELAKWGLGKRDVVANINFFSKVTAREDGDLVFHRDHAKPGDFIDLRFEMSALAVLSTCVHPLDSNPDYAPQAVRISAWRSGVAPVDDACRNSCPENQRGFINTERYFAA
jgi:urea carboxylase-associated protein 2